MAGHLKMEERDRIAQLRHQGADQNEIARALGRCPSTISRELRRNQTGNNYYAGQAQRETKRRRTERPLVRKMDDSTLNEKVRHHLAQEWAPAQIAGGLKQEHPDCPDRQVVTQGGAAEPLTLGYDVEPLGIGAEWPRLGWDYGEQAGCVSRRRRPSAGRENGYTGGRAEFAIRPQQQPTVRQLRMIRISAATESSLRLQAVNWPTLIEIPRSRWLTKRVCRQMFLAASRKTRPLT